MKTIKRIASILLFISFCFALTFGTYAWNDLFMRGVKSSNDKAPSGALFYQFNTKGDTAKISGIDEKHNYFMIYYKNWNNKKAKIIITRTDRTKKNSKPKTVKTITIPAKTYKTYDLKVGDNQQNYDYEIKLSEGPSIELAISSYEKRGGFRGIAEALTRSFPPTK
ncbi:MAG: hypothetical protein J6M39_09800 [Lachnospiraceae bacterium]|nr:hypothetical protein [Lachnospiraceae bacterium]